MARNSPESFLGTLFRAAGRIQVPEVKNQRRTADKVHAAELLARVEPVPGLARAGELVKSGRIISAIRHIEATNPALSRDQAKAIVDGIGFTREFSWSDWGSSSELERLRIRRL